jgi:hypothetical protein
MATYGDTLRWIKRLGDPVENISRPNLAVAEVFAAVFEILTQLHG